MLLSLYQFYSYFQTPMYTDLWIILGSICYWVYQFYSNFQTPMCTDLRIILYTPWKWRLMSMKTSTVMKQVLQLKAKNQYCMFLYSWKCSIGSVVLRDSLNIGIWDFSFLHECYSYMDIIIKEAFDLIKLVQLLSVISKSRACREDLTDHVTRLSSNGRLRNIYLIARFWLLGIMSCPSLLMASHPKKPLGVLP
jgi:hypothetical protein